MKKGLIIMMILSFVLLFTLSGCKEDVQQPTLEKMKYCETVDDCACGTLKTDGSCFAGNKDYVNTQEQCPDFCSGIAGNLKLTCENNQCKQESILPAQKDEITKPSIAQVQADCIESNGKWNEEYKECTGISQTQCTNLGGTFDECASACRHNPEAEACIMMCVQVCTFN